jgi:hypothetical protein
MPRWRASTLYESVVRAGELAQRRDPDLLSVSTENADGHPDAAGQSAGCSAAPRADCSGYRKLAAQIAKAKHLVVLTEAPARRPRPRALRRSR